ncbi:MAG TPA: haloacid dehalogenase type II [Gammaproteobacteria bacterium]
MDRREFLKLTAAGFAATSLPLRVSAAPAGIRVVLFDAFPVFDPRPVFALVKQMYPEQGQALTELWRTRQFEYTWLRTLTGRYQDFWSVTRDALRFSAKTLKLEMSAADEERLMGAYLKLKAWPDAADALRTLKAAGLKLAFLSNFTRGMLDAGIANSGLEGVFDKVLSTDLAGAFKPDARAYHLGVDAFGLPKEQMLFAAFAGWDAAGAKAFGYPTFWVNRLGQPAEELGAAVDGSGAGLAELLAYVKPA